ncbi:TraY domain-containing protein [Legionella drozanskii]|nr:TraY domain-containing protein [Legionella drozanskii]
MSESCGRSNRKKIQEATLRLEDHLNKFRSISELNYAIPLDEVGE